MSITELDEETIAALAGGEGNGEPREPDPEPEEEERDGRPTFDPDFKLPKYPPTICGDCGPPEPKRDDGESRPPERPGERRDT